MTARHHSQPIDFPRAFSALTGNEPFPWQKELYRRLGVPRLCVMVHGTPILDETRRVALRKPARETRRGRMFAPYASGVVDDPLKDHANPAQDAGIAATAACLCAPAALPSVQSEHRPATMCIPPHLTSAITAPL